MIETNDKSKANYIINEDGSFSVSNAVTDKRKATYFINSVKTNDVAIAINRIELAMN